LAGYGSVAVGRDDGKKKGEMNPVFYNTARFEYLADSTFWLSKTPGKAGSKAWNSSLPRIVSWVKLKDKNSGKTIYYFNTHFAHDSDTARIMSARLLLREIRRIAGRERFILTGDFNTNPETRAYSVLTGSVKGKPLLVDSYSISETPPSGPAGTFNGWSDTPREGRIDYIFVKRGSSVKSLTTVLKKEGSVFISDHWPVKAVVIPE
jgi:endonuclease/exonuclease/phosphatase family metal-dependent hydrolase